MSGRTSLTKIGQILDNEGKELDFAALERVEQFAGKLGEWNRIHNLSGAKTEDAVYNNILDSLYPINFVPKPDSLLDVGTGAGFPGLLLAIAWPDTLTVLAEPLNKRAAFLRFVAQDLELDNVEVFKGRVEKLEHEPFKLISSRAVTDTKLLLDLTKNLSNKETQYLFYKGSRVEEELKGLEHQPDYAIVQKEKRNYLWIRKL